MEADIIDGKIGTVGAYDLEFKAGKLVAKVGVNQLGMSAEIVVAVDAEAVLDVIAAAIPGTIDDAILGVAKAALKMKMV